MNLYDKQQERLDKGDFEGAIKYKNTFRIESQIKKRKIKKYLKQDGVSQDLDNYWNKLAFVENHLELFENYLYKGNYYRLDKAKQIIKNDTDLKDFIQSRLCLFLTRVNKFGMNNIYKYCSKQTIKNYIEILNNIKCPDGSIGVNPITIGNDKNVTCIKSMFLRCKEISEKNYFK